MTNSVDNVVERFANSGDAGWELSSPQVTQFVFTELDKFEHVVLLAKSAHEFYLLNRRCLRVRVFIPNSNGQPDTEELT